MSKYYPIKINVNNNIYELKVKANETLTDVLRNKLHFTATKQSCGTGDCGSCTILIDGLAVCSCLVLAVTLKGKEITTLEGLNSNGKLHPIQKAFLEQGAVQCGFCTPGTIMSVMGLLGKIKDRIPTEEEIKETIKGNLCRCTGYKKIIEAVRSIFKEKED